MKAWTVAAILLAMAEPALAHHAMDGATPLTALQGLIAGLAHPILGLDHFAAVLAVGGLAALAGTGLWPLAAYVVLTIAGAALHAAGWGLPGAEPSVAISVLLLGALLAATALRSAPLAFVLFGATGFIHGYALGESVVGAEPAPLYTYFAGLAAVQFFIAFAAMCGARWLLLHDRIVTLRLGGAAIAGFAFATLLQTLSS